MASPLSTAKKSVNLAAGEVRVSKIRRDPPPKLKAVPVRDAEDNERQDVLIGVVAFALAIFVIMLAFAAWSGWTPRTYILDM